MMTRATIVLLLGLAAGCTSWLLLNSFYQSDFFASEEAKTSLEVTEEQTNELESSKFKVDLLSFGLAGALIGLAGGLAGNPRATLKSAALAGGLGLLIGFGGGALGALLGHVYDANVPFPRDAMLYWFGRWSAISLPICISCAVAVASAGSVLRDMGAAVSGAVLGGLLAVVVYCLLSGVISPIESRNAVFPTHSVNRLTILLGLATLPPLGGLFQLRPRKTKIETDNS